MEVIEAMVSLLRNLRRRTGASDAPALREESQRCAAEVQRAWGSTSQAYGVRRMIRQGLAKVMDSGELPEDEVKKAWAYVERKGVEISKDFL